MKKLLWLDDIRDPYADMLVYRYVPNFSGDVVWVRNYNDFVLYIDNSGLPDIICFDFDLGDDVARDSVARGMSKRQARRIKKTTINGAECAKWLIKYCTNNKTELPECVVHSASPDGRNEIIKILSQFCI